MSTTEYADLLAAVEDLRHDDPDPELWRRFLDVHPELAEYVPRAEGRIERTRRSRRRPTSEMTLRDGSPLRIPTPDDLDVDGDPLISSAVTPVGGIYLLLQGGHGFTVETVTKDPAKQAQTACKFCGAVMTNPVDGWLCELDDAGSSFWACECNWCLCRRQHERGEYLERGRPRIQCGASECKRRLRTEQQRERRAKQKALVAG